MLARMNNWMRPSPIECRAGGVMNRKEHYVGRRAMEKRGRPKSRWLDGVKDDIKEKKLLAE